jgi:hypothetical protein
MWKFQQESGFLRTSVARHVFRAVSHHMLASALASQEALPCQPPLLLRCKENSARVAKDFPLEKLPENHPTEMACRPRSSQPGIEHAMRTNKIRHCGTP